MGKTSFDYHACCGKGGLHPIRSMGYASTLDEFFILNRKIKGVGHSFKRAKYGILLNFDTAYELVQSHDYRLCMFCQRYLSRDLKKLLYAKDVMVGIEFG